jgi:hypothetical protein
VIYDSAVIDWIISEFIEDLNLVVDQSATGIKIGEKILTDSTHIH